MEAAGKGVKQAAADAQLTAPMEMSYLRETDHRPGRFLLCMRVLESKSTRVVTYAVFFDNNDYKGLRLPVILVRKAELPPVLLEGREAMTACPSASTMIEAKH